VAPSHHCAPEWCGLVDYSQRHGTFREWGELLATYGVDGRKIEAAKDRMSFWGGRKTFGYTGHVPTVASFDRITVEPGKCGGKPCVRGMRITARRVLELLASYPDHAALLVDYPYLEPEDLNQVLRYAAAAVDDESLSIDRVA
jgi:uncharacterized protein (DUF433 family)